MSAGKRKNLTVSEKLEILEKFDHKGASETLISFAFSVGLPESSVRTILRDREKIKSAAVGGDCKRRKLKAGQHSGVEAVLVDWIHECRNRPQPIALSGPIIQEKAREIGKKINDEFSASNGWLSRFVKRHGIIYRQICGEAAEVSAAVGDDFNFQDYATVDDAVTTSEIRELDNIISDNANDAGNNSDSEDKVSSETGDGVPARCEALAAISTLRSYISAMNLNCSQVLQNLSAVENFVINIRPFS
ncbi:hypothetical protein V9T40_002451 [Parthenolecanium corni]|uniref:HTH CENPB-type domain-containing protein n=1 Tax=Parthenolecanium corni TaxID=536013 RepID=A0AAN9Y5L9_9HEMI